jgi:hypothetical protein
MTTPGEYVAKVEALVAGVSPVLTSDEEGEVRHLIDHNECGEALVSLAWIISDGNKLITPAQYRSILALSLGLVDPQDLPPDLEEHVRSDRWPPSHARMGELLAEAQSLVRDFGDLLPATDLGLVHRLVQHGEIGEGMVGLAWCIVNRDQRLTPGQYHRLRGLVGDLIEDARLPNNLADYVS